MTNIAAVGRNNNSRGLRRGVLLRNSVALVALSLFTAPLLPQAALADCSTSGSTLTCTGMDDTGGTISGTGVPPNPVVVNIQSGALVTNTDDGGDPAIEVTATGSGAVVDFNMLSPDSSIVAGDNEYAVEVDITNGSGTSSSTFDVNGIVQSTEQDAFNIELENGSITFDVGDTGVIRGDNEGIDISSGSFSSNRTVSVGIDIEEGGQVRGSDGNAIEVSVNTLNIFGGSGDASATVKLNNDGRMTAGNNGLSVSSIAGDAAGGARVAKVDVTGTNGKTGVIDAGDDGISVFAAGEAADVTFDMSNDGRIFAGEDGIDVNAAATGAVNGSMKFVNNGQIGSLLDPTGDNGVNFFVLGASGSVSAEVQNSKGATIFSKGDGIGIAITGGVDGPVKVTNDGAINAGGTGIQVLSNGQVDIGGPDGTINGVSGGINVVTTDGDVNIIDPGLVTATNGSAIVGATLNGNTTITTNKAVSATNGNGVYGASVNGDTNVTTNDKVSVTNGTYGAAANAVNGNATLTINGGIDPPSIGGSAATVNGDATIIVNNNLVHNVEAIDIGLFGANVGTGVVSITNNGETITSGGAGVIAAKLGEGVVGGDSIIVKNLGGRIEAGTGPGIAVTAADPDSIFDPPNAIVNNVWIENNNGGYITGAGNLLALPPTPSVGVITDGALALLNDNKSVITNTVGTGGLAIGVIAGKGITVTNDNGSSIVGAATIGSTAGSVHFTNDHGSSWSSEGISVLGALGADQDVILDNFNGSSIEVDNGLLALAADRNVEINNISELDEWAPRSSITFGGSSGSLMVAVDGYARITNRASSITMGDLAPGVSANLMFAGTDAEIINQDGASFTMNNLVNGIYMNAGEDARIVNERGSTFTMTGINGIALVADVDAVIKNSQGSSFSMMGLDGIYMNADQDALIINEKGSTFMMSGLNGTALVAGRDAQIENTKGSSFTLSGLAGTYLDAGQDARIINEKGSDFTMTGIVGTALFADRDAEIINSEGGDFLMEGLTGTYLNAERDARIVNEKGSDFTMRGLTGTVLVADDDAEIINTKGGDLLIEGLNGAVMIADADNNDIGRALIENSKGSVMTFRGITGGQIQAGSEIAFINDDSSEMNFIGLNGFLIEPGVNSYFDNDGFVFVDGFTGFAGLDNFNNNNIVSMQEGEVDDVLALGGNYNANSELWIDAELTPGGVADLLIVGGNVTGITHVGVNDLDGSPGQYDPEGVLFAVVAGSTDVSNFTTGGGIDKGLFRYDTYLRVDDPALDAGADGWYLASTLDGEAYEFPGIMSGAQALWNASTGTWLDRTADLRVALGDGAIDPNCAKDCLPEIGNVTPGVWMKALAGTQSRDNENRSAPPPGLQGETYGYDNSYDQNFWGFLIGADTGQEWTTDSGHNAAWLVGVMGGYLGSQLGFNDSNTDVDYEAFTLGAYMTYLNGGFFVDGTLKADLGTMDYDSDLGGGFSESTSSDFTSIGGLVDMGYRFDVSSGVFIEPMATLSYVSTSMDDADVLGTNVSFDDGESLQGRLGARIGASIDGAGMKSELFLEGSVWNEFMGDYDAQLSSNGYNVKTDLDTSGVYGEVGVGANVFGEAGWNGFLTGAVQFGEDDFLGYSGNLGLRYSW